MLAFWKNEALTREISHSPGLERETERVGRELLASMRQHERGVRSMRSWSDAIIEWATRDPQFKVQMFRFVDAFPTLQSTTEIYELLNDYLSQPGVQAPPGFGLGMAAGSLAKGTLVRWIAAGIRSIANNFIVGADLEAAIPRLERLWKRGIAFSIDLLGEACLSNAEADSYRRHYLRLVGELPDRMAAWKPQATLESDHLGPIPRCNVSIKISSLSAQIKTADHEGSIDRIYESIEPILAEAARRQVFINFDMEQFAHKDLTLDLFTRCCDRIDFPAGIALQA
jgi:RHH-type proline utilization regulon transcriptional repressor/proline dehydrogenase/delta 1-pyrroline-5-carboxylate dehydrogenase